MEDGKDNAVNLLHHVIVPKADDFVAKRVQVFGPLFVVFFLFQMLRAVQFDDEFLFDTNKIRDEVSDGMLPSKIGECLNEK